jgi:hypothetical protein
MNGCHHSNRDSSYQRNQTFANALKQNSSDNIPELRERVTQFKKQAQLLLERFQRGEISQTDAQAEAKRIDAEVAEAERMVDELKVQHRDGSRKKFTSGT